MFGKILIELFDKWLIINTGIRKKNFPDYFPPVGYFDYMV